MYRDGLSSRHLAIAALARTSNTSPKQIRPADYTRELSTTARSIRRRAHRLVAHLLSPIFTFILKHTHHVSTHDPQPTWSTTRTRIAEHCFLRAHSQRHTARALNLSIHHIRREVLAIRALFEQERRPQ